MEEIEGTSHDNNGNIISSFGLTQYVDPPSSTGALVVNNMIQPRSENPNPFPVGLTNNTPSAVAATSASASTSASAATSASASTSAPAAVAKASEYDAPLSPMPISSSVPLATEFASRKRGHVEPPPISNNNNNYWLKYSCPVVGPSFTHHVLSVNAGEDVTMKIMTFSQPSCRAICILSAYGPISDVALRQPMTSGGTLTYKGHFEIISLTGSFIPTESGGTRIRAGGMSVSLAGPDCRVFGGGLAGHFIAASPVHVIVGSFFAGQEESQSQQNEQMKKQLRERFGVPTPAQASNISVGGSAEDIKARYELYKPVGLQAPHMKMQTRERFGIPTPAQASNISVGGSAEDIKARYELYKPVGLQAPHMKMQTGERFGIPPPAQASNISVGGSAEDLKARYELYKPVLLKPPHLKKQTRARSGIPPTAQASNILFGGSQDKWGSPSS